MEFNELLSSAHQSVQLLQGGTNLATSLRQMFKKSEGGELSREDAEKLVLEMQNALLDAKTAQLEVLEKLIALKEQILKTDRRLEISRRYILMDTGFNTKVLTLREELDDEIPHFICPHCADDDRKIVLQRHDESRLKCGRCKTLYQIATKPPPPHIPRSHNFG